MKLSSLFIATLALLAGVSLRAADKEYQLKSPSGGLTVTVTAGEQLKWSISMNGTTVLEPSALSMTLDNGTVFGRGVKVRKASQRTVFSMVTPVVYRSSQVADYYGELTLTCKGYSVLFRAYDNGAAYRFIADQKKPFNVLSEEAGFALTGPSKGFIPYCRKSGNDIECQFFTSFEAMYNNIPVTDWESGRLAFLPVTLDAPDGMKLCITESALTNYPGMYLSNEDKDTKLEAVFAPYPKVIEQGGHNMLQGLVRSREDFIAKAGAKEAFPWRIVIVSEYDKDLLTCDIPWLLGDAPDPAQDFSWVKPGKVAWDWWNAWNIYGVNFEAGINNDTYKYYIDFASKNGIEYVILDEGWAVNKQADLFQVVPEIDLSMLCQYARDRGVGLILWAGCWPFNQDMEAVCAKYSAMGIKGWKIDFMDYDDQQMVQFYRRAAETAARYGMMCDFHGAFKPTGLNRTYPNVINFEGVYGLENMKWNQRADEVTYDVTIPFVRLVAGPADYTQGAMRNGTKANFRAVNTEPMSQGTRCHQLAEYIVFDAPLTMLCDSPSNYLQEPECTEFIASVPTVWDETIALDGKIGEYVVMARRKGDAWYIGALNGWEARDLEIDLSFLPADKTRGTAYQDGVNAHRAARDYKKTGAQVSGGKVKAHLAPGGGYVLIIN